MSDTNWLIAERFRHVGHWSSPHMKLQRYVLLERTRGIYAFVAEERVRYIGKATSLRHRVRNYNRAFVPESSKPFRKVHYRMQRAWSNCTTIDVWVYDFKDVKDGNLRQLEANWIKKIEPDWND